MTERVLNIARVIDVDPNNYTINVQLDNGTYINDIQVATSFFNSVEGSGIIGHPQIDSLALVASASNGEHYAIGFIASIDQKRSKTDALVLDDSGYRSGRPLIRPGDVSINGPYGSFVKMESSGVLHLKGADLSQVYLVPDPANMIKMICDNLHIDVGYSKIRLENNRVLNKTNFEFTIKPNPNDTSEANDVSIKMGKDGNVFSISLGGTQVFHIDPKKTVTINNNLMVRA